MTGKAPQTPKETKGKAAQILKEIKGKAPQTLKKTKRIMAKLTFQRRK